MTLGLVVSRAIHRISRASSLPVRPSMDTAVTAHGDDFAFVRVEPLTDQITQNARITLEWNAPKVFFGNVNVDVHGRALGFLHPAPWFALPQEGSRRKHKEGARLQLSVSHQSSGRRRFLRS